MLDKRFEEMTPRDAIKIWLAWQLWKIVRIPLFLILLGLFLGWAESN